MCGVKGQGFIVFFNSIQSVGLWKCLYDHYLANKAYFRASIVFQRYHSSKHLWEFYQQDGDKSQLASKLRHCHPVYWPITGSVAYNAGWVRMVSWADQRQGTDSHAIHCWGRQRRHSMNGVIGDEVLSIHWLYLMNERRHLPRSESIDRLWDRATARYWLVTSRLQLALNTRRLATVSMDTMRLRLWH